MKYFPLKAVIFCILVVPLLFTLTLTCFEEYLNNKYENRIYNHIDTESKIPGRSTPLNSVTREQFVINLLSRYIPGLAQTDTLIGFFNLDIVVRVISQSGEVIYINYNKSHANTGNNGWNHESETNDNRRRNERDVISEAPHDMGVSVEVAVLLRQNLLFFNAVLFIHMLFSMSVFLFFYRRVLNRIRREETLRRKTITSLEQYEQEYLDKLESLKQERELLADKLRQAKSDYQEESRRASIAEEELFDEIVQLEKKLEENIALQKQKEEEVENLKNQLEKVERRKSSGKKRRTAESVEKRFANLYKNIEMNQKAVDGFLDLDDEDMQLKAEEVIHQLNDDPSGITVKRKVFAGKKNKTASFEVLFSYNGRLYFRNIDGNKIEILVIGTKNTQDKDMEFLHYI